MKPPARWDDEQEDDRPQENYELQEDDELQESDGLLNNDQMNENGQLIENNQIENNQIEENDQLQELYLQATPMEDQQADLLNEEDTNHDAENSDIVQENIEENNSDETNEHCTNIQSDLDPSTDTPSPSYVWHTDTPRDTTTDIQRDTPRDTHGDTQRDTHRDTQRDTQRDTRIFHSYITLTTDASKEVSTPSEANDDDSQNKEQLDIETYDDKTSTATSVDDVEKPGEEIAGNDFTAMYLSQPSSGNHSSVGSSNDRKKTPGNYSKSIAQFLDFYDVPEIEARDLKPEDFSSDKYDGRQGSTTQRFLNTDAASTNPFDQQEMPDYYLKSDAASTDSFDQQAIPDEIPGHYVKSDVPSTDSCDQQEIPDHYLKSDAPSANSLDLQEIPDHYLKSDASFDQQGIPNDPQGIPDHFPGHYLKPDAPSMDSYDQQEIPDHYLKSDAPSTDSFDQQGIPGHYLSRCTNATADKSFDDTSIATATATPDIQVSN